MSAESEFQRAAQAYRNGEFSTAVLICEELIQQSPIPDALPAILNLMALGLTGQGLMFSAQPIASKRLFNSNPMTPC